MQQQKIQPPVPIAHIKQLFKLPVYKIKPMAKQPSYFRAVTAYGNMCLVCQQLVNDNVNKCNEKLEQRNSLMAGYSKYFPLIYEQHVIVKQNVTICLTLMEDCVFMSEQFRQQNLYLKPLNFSKLIKNLHFIQKQGYVLKEGFRQQQILYLTNSQQVVYNFTQLFCNPQGQQTGTSYLKQLKAFIQKTLISKYNNTNQINQIIFIKGKIYTFQPHIISQANDYVQLLIFFNLCPDLQVNMLSKVASTAKIKRQEHREPNGINMAQKQIKNNLIHSNVESPAKIRKMPIKQLQDNPLIQIYGKQYSLFNFSDGKCTNCLRQVFYEQLKAKFIQDNSLYKLQQFQHLVVHIFKNHSSQSSKQQIVTVYPPVSKVELISFLIAYIKCIEPVMKSIQYFCNENTIKLVFSNKKNQSKILRMVFYQQYIVKDQQISMVLEKSNIEKCKLDLRNMKISDSFLIFLAHSQKTKGVQQIYLTDNYGLSDHGLSTLLKSPYSCNLKTLSLTAENCQNQLLQQSLQLISQKKSLVKLFLKKSTLGMSTLNEQIDVSSLELIELESLGVRVTLSSVMKGSLKILRLDQLVSVEQLKNIKHLRLVQLRVRLAQIGKKSLIDSISNISGLSSLSSSFSGSFGNKTQSAARVFAQGQSRHSLKVLDLSLSNCKYKTIHPLLVMNELEKIMLDGCINLGAEYQQISPKVLFASFANVQLNLQQLSIILDRNKELVQLNIINTKITKHEIVKLLSKRKLFVSDLILSQLQYTNKLLEVTQGYQLIGCIELYINKLLQPEQQYSLNSLIVKGAQSQKIIRFIFTLQQDGDAEEAEIKKQLLIDKITKFFIMGGISMENLEKFYINKMRISQLLQIQQNFQVQDSCQSSVASSVAISADRCKILSSPKMIVRRNSDTPIYFKSLQKQTIEKFTHRFVKFMRQNKLFLSIDLSNNKLIGKDVIKILITYAKDLVKQIDFRGCLFALDQIIDQIFQFSHLEAINDGIYSIYLNKENFAYRSQKYLKLFMHLRSTTQLKIHCQQIEQVQILFSVLSHIIDQASPKLKSLSIIFSQIALNRQSLQFFTSAFSLIEIKKFQFIIKECQNIDQCCSELWQKQINNLRLVESISLSLPTYNYPYFNLANLKQINIQFPDGKIQENQLNKCLKNLPNSKKLKSLKINLTNCMNISNLSRVFGVLPVGLLLERLTSLQHLSLNLQYCPLKDQSLIQVLTTLPRCPQLRLFELNVSFAISNFGDFVGCIQQIVEQFTKPVIAKIICVNQNSNKFLLRTQNLSQKGVQFIL